MRIPFFNKYPVDLNDQKSVRENATYLPSAEAAWPIRGNGRLMTGAELDARVERMRRNRARAFGEDL
jgi:hypothetical protein